MVTVTTSPNPGPSRAVPDIPIATPPRDRLVRDSRYLHGGLGLCLVAPHKPIQPLVKVLVSPLVFAVQQTRVGSRSEPLLNLQTDRNVLVAGDVRTDVV